MAADKDRVLEFLRTAFFDTAAALECQLAAMCLTLRGVSIVRAFITVGPGGVGQSLNTCLIANLFGGSDMNVFYSEDELRKQAETFTGKVNISRITYPPPRTRRISLSWFFSVESGPACVPQVMSGDPVAARLPYATEMVTFPGWKRFEMNETLKFHGVTEMTFPLIVRRSLIVNCNGGFVGAQRLASLPGHPRGTFSCRRT